MTHTHTQTPSIVRVLALAALVLVAALTASPAMASSPQGQININKADAAELAMLPRIGPALAQRIVEYRETNESFKSLDDLLLVSGIGEKTFALLRPFITLSGDSNLGAKVSLAAAQEAAQAAQGKVEKQGSAKKDNDGSEQ